jgi:hypothetical protein
MRLARMVLTHRLLPRDPLAGDEGAAALDLVLPN